MSEVRTVKPQPKPVEPPPAQCTETRHIYDTDGRRIVGDTCRCGLRKIKRMQ